MYIATTINTRKCRQRRSLRLRDEGECSLTRITHSEHSSFYSSKSHAIAGILRP